MLFFSENSTFVFWFPLFEIRPLALLPASGKQLPSDALVKT